MQPPSSNPPASKQVLFSPATCGQGNRRPRHHNDSKVRYFDTNFDNPIFANKLASIINPSSKLALFGFALLTAKGGFIFIILCQN